MTKQVAINTFEGGLMMDQNPLTSKNNVLQSALNATLITMNGDDYVLQNDMGNGRVESAYLPSGYVPIGVVSYGGIVYVASCNPLTGYGQIGSFPSPERNVESQSINGTGVTIQTDDFFTNQTIAHLIVKKLLFNGNIIRPGDLYGLYGLYSKTNTGYKQNDPFSNLVTYKLAVQDSSGNLRYIEETPETLTDLSSTTPSTNLVDSYRNAININNYKSFDSKIAGQVYLVGILNTIQYIDVNVTNILKVDTTYSLNLEIKVYYQCPLANIANPTVAITNGSGATITFTKSDSVDYTSDLKYITYNYAITGITSMDNIEYSVTPNMSYISESSDQTIQVALTNLALKNSINVANIGTGLFSIQNIGYTYTTDYMKFTLEYEKFPKYKQDMNNIQLLVAELSTFNTTPKWDLLYSFPNENSYYAHNVVYINYQSGLFQENKIYIAKLQYTQNGNGVLTVVDYPDQWCIVTSDYANSNFGGLPIKVSDSKIWNIPLDVQTTANKVSQNVSVGAFTQPPLVVKTLPTNPVLDISKITNAQFGYQIIRNLNLNIPLFSYSGSITFDNTISNVKVTKEANKSGVQAISGEIKDLTSTTSDAVTDSLYYIQPTITNDSLSITLKTASQLHGVYSGKSFSVTNVYEPYIRHYKWADLFGFNYSGDTRKGITVAVYRRTASSANAIEAINVIPCTFLTGSTSKASMKSIVDTGESGGNYSVFYNGRRYGSDSKSQVLSSERIEDISKALKFLDYGNDNMIFQLYCGYTSTDTDFNSLFDFLAYRTSQYDSGYQDNGAAYYYSMGHNSITNSTDANTVNRHAHTIWGALIWKNDNDYYLIGDSTNNNFNNANYPDIEGGNYYQVTNLYDSFQQFFQDVYIPSTQTDITVSAYVPTQDLLYDNTVVNTLYFQINSTKKTDTITILYNNISLQTLLNKVDNGQSTINITLNSQSSTVQVQSETKGFEDLASSINSATIPVACLDKDEDGDVTDTILTDSQGNQLQLGKIYKKDTNGLTITTFQNIALRNNQLVPSKGTNLDAAYCGRICARGADGNGWYTSLVLDLPGLILK